MVVYQNNCQKFQSSKSFKQYNFLGDFFTSKDVSILRYVK